MIIINLAGGLGNQMFQYAFGKTVSLNLNTELLLHPQKADISCRSSCELTRVFNIEERFARKSDLKKILGFRANPWIMKKMRSRNWLRGQHYLLEPHFHYDESMFNVRDNTFIKGYWQSEKYFSKYRNVMLETYAFNTHSSDSASEVMKKIQTHTSASIHIRRGDYLSNHAAHSVHGDVGLDYYKKAISHLTNKLDDILYVIFSDDPDWVQTNASNFLGGNKYIIVSDGSHERNGNDMMLMSLCQHNIIANSSFSWWGAWLNTNTNKIVIAPKNWFSIKNKDPKDLCPESWLRI